MGIYELWHLQNLVTSKKILRRINHWKSKSFRLVPKQIIKIDLKPQHPVCFSETSVRVNNMRKAQNRFCVTHSNKITLTQLIHINIPFKIKKMRWSFLLQWMSNAVALVCLCFFDNWNLMFFRFSFKLFSNSFFGPDMWGKKLWSIQALMNFY